MPQKPTIPRVCEQCGTAFLAKAHDITRGGARYCGKSCAMKVTRRAIVAQYRERFPAYFWARVDRSGDCWPWTAGTDHAGYGQVRAPTGETRAHRIAWELTHGPIPAGMFACHRCDKPICCNPAHLFLGTH